MISVKQFVVSQLRENTYLLIDEKKSCVVVDPGSQSAEDQRLIDDYILSNSLNVEAVWLTHMHFDHIFGVPHIVRRWNVPVYACADDVYLIEQNKRIAVEWQIPVPEDFTIDHFVCDGDNLQFGGRTFQALQVPGHTRGSIVYYCADEKFCLSGDVLFRCSVGRADLPGGDEVALIEGIKRKLMTLPDDVCVLPGHGGHTSVGDEKRYNPYIAF